MCLWLYNCLATERLREILSFAEESVNVRAGTNVVGETSNQSTAVFSACRPLPFPYPAFPYNDAVTKAIAQNFDKVMKVQSAARTVRLFILSSAVLLSSVTIELAQDGKSRVDEFRAERHQEFLDPKKSPLEPAEVPKFKGLKYFKINSHLRLQALFVRTPNEKKFNMPTSSGITKVYLKYGELRFKLGNQPHSLGVYQSEALSQTEKYKNYLLIPFTDLTNGDETYGAGRYIDFEIPASELVMLDFNLAYNPSRAYSNRYNCPIPPKENRLQARITAGEKVYRRSSSKGNLPH